MKMLRVFQKTRFAVAYPVIVLMFIFAETSDPSILTGFITALLGEGIRLWSNGYVGHNKVNRTRKNEGQAPIGQLITAGPYAYVRNPLYLGTFLILLGVCIAASSIGLGVIVLGMFIYVYHRKIRQEESLLTDEIGKGYEAYRMSVPQWIPHKMPFKNRQGRWSWLGIRASKEWKTMIWIAVLFIVLYLRQELYQEGMAFTDGVEFPKHLFLLGTALALAACDGWVTLKGKRMTHEN